MTKNGKILGRKISDKVTCNKVTKFCEQIEHNKNGATFERTFNGVHVRAVFSVHTQVDTYLPIFTINYFDDRFDGGLLVGYRSFLSANTNIMKKDFKKTIEEYINTKE